jgi:hypothetical protein
VTFSILSSFLRTQLYLKAPDKAVILSAAPLRWIASRELYGAESKDPGDALLPHAARSFQPPKPHIRSAAIRMDGPEYVPVSAERKNRGEPGG